MPSADVLRTTVNAKDMLSEITLDVTIKGWRRARWRLYIAMALIRLAARVGGVGLDVNGMDTGD